MQRLTVAPEVAERALELAIARPPTFYGMCAFGIVELLQDLGFEGLEPVLLPINLMHDFAQIPGVETFRFRLPAVPGEEVTGIRVLLPPL